MAASEGSPRPPIVANYERFREGLARQRGYGLEEQGDRLVLNFNPLFVESEKPHAQPTLKLRFRRDGNMLVLEDFLVVEEDREKPINLEAAHDALQIWMDYMCD